MIVVMTLQFKRKTICFFINHGTNFHTFNDPGSMYCAMRQFEVYSCLHFCVCL